MIDSSERPGNEPDERADRDPLRARPSGLSAPTAPLGLVAVIERAVSTAILLA
jgi:hypothetical protein